MVEINFPECMQLLSYLKGGTEEPYHTALDYAIRFMALVQKESDADLIEVIEYSERLDAGKSGMERRQALKALFKILPGGKDSSHGTDSSL